MDFAECSLKSRKILAYWGFPTWGVLYEDDHRYDGVCRYQQQHITLRTGLVAKAKTFRDVLPVVLHEVAHALTPGDSHGPHFHAKLRELIAFYTFGNS